MSGDLAGAIVFTDIVGFTEITDLHGDEFALELLALQDRAVSQALPEHARLVKEIGDGLLLWFDNAREAVETSLCLQDSFGTMTPDGIPLWVRIGVHWGSPKRRGDDIVGRDVNLASRIADLAGPGEVLCSGDVFDAVRADSAPVDIIFEPLGPVFVRGIAEPVTLMRVERAPQLLGDSA